jgi:hypothetical protein
VGSREKATSTASDGVFIGVNSFIANRQARRSVEIAHRLSELARFEFASICVLLCEIAKASVHNELPSRNDAPIRSGTILWQSSEHFRSLALARV